MVQIFLPQKSNKIEKIMTDEEWRYKKGMSIALSQAKIENGLSLRKSDKEFTCNGYIEMRGMNLRGNLEIEGIINQFPEAQRKNFALDIEGATVSGTIFLRNLSITGKIYCSGLQAHLLYLKDLEVVKAKDSGNDEYLIDASRMKIDAHIHIFQVVKICGGFDLSSSKVGGEFCMGKKHKTNGQVGENNGSLNQFPIVEGILNLKHVLIGQFRVDIEKWIHNCKNSNKSMKAWLDGFEFSAVTDPEGHPIKTDHEGSVFLKWLETNDVSSGGAPNDKVGKDRFRPQPHEHLAGTLERMGYSDVSKKIKINKAEHEIEDNIINSRICKKILLKLRRVILRMVGYGHDLKWAWVATFLIVLMGAVVFQIAYNKDRMGIAKEYVYLNEKNGIDSKISLIKNNSVVDMATGIILFQDYFCTDKCDDATKMVAWPPAEYTNFHSLIYSIDIFLPLVNLHEEEAWLPKANGFGYFAWAFLWFEILAGWFLSTLIVASLTGIIKKD